MGKQRKGGRAMLRYALKRVLLAALTVLLVAAITFIAMHCVPGGPSTPKRPTDPATKAALLSRFHLDKSLPEQFLLYLGARCGGTWAFR